MGLTELNRFTNMYIIDLFCAVLQAGNLIFGGNPLFSAADFAGKGLFLAEHVFFFGALSKSANFT